MALDSRAAVPATSFGRCCRVVPAEETSHFNRCTTVCLSQLAFAPFFPLAHASVMDFKYEHCPRNFNGDFCAGQRHVFERLPFCKCTPVRPWLRECVFLQALRTYYWQCRLDVQACAVSYCVFRRLLREMFFALCSLSVASLFDTR